MKKICFLGGYGGGVQCGERLVGPQRLSVELGIRLAKEMDVCFVHLGDKDHRTTLHELPEIIIRNGAFSFFKTLRAIKKINPDIIHGHGSLNMAWALFAFKKLTGKKTIITFTDFKRNIINNYSILNKLDAIVVQTEHARQKLIQQGVHFRLIKKITYGIEEKFYHSNLCPEIRGISHKILLYYGDARQERGIHLLLQSLPHLSPDIFVLLCVRKFEKGFGFEEMKSLSSVRLKVMALSEYPCPIEDIIHSCDVVVLPFIKNTLEPPLTIMEVSAVGKKLITSNVGGTAEVASSGAVILESITPFSLAAAINKEFEQKSMQKSEQKSGKKSEQSRRQSRRYDWNETVKEILELYRTP